MTDSVESRSIDAVVDQLALSSTLCDVTDLGELARMHTQVGVLLKMVEEREEWLGSTDFSKFGTALEALLEGIVLETYSDLEGSLGLVRQSISEIQRSLRLSSDSAPLPADRSFVETVIAAAGGGAGEIATDDAKTEASAAPVEADTSTLEAIEASPSASPAATAPQDTTQESAEHQTVPLILNKDELEYARSFVTEAYEHIDNIEAAVLELEQALADQAKINELFRPFHTIKGMAGFLNFHDVSRLTHKAETLLDLARKGQLAFTIDHINVIFATVDALKEQVGSIADYLDRPMGEVVPQPDIRDLLVRLHNAADTRSGAGAVPTERVPEAGSAGGSPAEETVAGPSQPSEKAAGSPASAAASKPSAKKDLVVRVDTARLDHLVNMVGELLVAQTLVTQNPIVGEHVGLSRDVAQVAKITREVQEIAMAMRMVTLQQTFQKMGRLARDVAQKAGKLVDFEISGEDTELDKNVIEEIGDPLMHMVRNAVDHGVETPEVRVAAGKSARGRVHLHACHQGGNIVIQVTDDGRGLDPQKLIQKGIERGLVSPDEQLTEQQAFALVMQAGFSTAEKITDISGRGVGMDVVKRNIEKLRGKVEIASRKGEGSTFTVRLPLTLAIIDGMLVGVEKDRFIIPTISVDQSLQPKKEQIFTIQNRGEVLEIRGELCPLLRLDALFGIRSERPPVWESMVVLVYVDGRRVGLVVDELLRQQQIVIKTLGEQFKQVRGVSGAAILGDGRIGLILEPSGLATLYNGRSTG